MPVDRVAGIPYDEAMPAPIDVDWNDDNEARHVAKHGIPFAVAVFLDPRRVEVEDDRFAYAERRWNTIGTVGAACLHVTFAMEGDSARIISARPASRKDRRAYAS